MSKPPMKNKYDLRAQLTLKKHTGEQVLVEVEGVRMSKWLNEPMYDVREIESKQAYPASESSLSRAIAKAKGGA